MRARTLRLVGLALLAVACDDAPRPEETVRVCLPGGTFEMGTRALDPCSRFTESTVLCRADETSERAFHAVFLTPFFVDRTEVSNAQYRDCVEHGPCTQPERKDAGDAALGTWERFYADGERWAAYPVVNVDHAQAAEYCAWKDGRLPTEAEWEFAARGPQGTADDAWPWGDAPDPLTACREDAESIAFGRCGAGFPFSVGHAALDRRAGVRDLLGNVAEWVLDAWDPLAFCSDGARALYHPSSDGVLGLPQPTDPAALDALCAQSTDCLSECDAERFHCVAACAECADSTGEAYGECQVETVCLQQCLVPDGCDCAEAPAPGGGPCAAACACLPGCRVEPFPPAESPSSCLKSCYEGADQRCRAAGCMTQACRTACGDVLRESNRLCDARSASDGRPVEVPVVLTHPAGLEGYHVVKGGDYLVAEAEACELRAGRRRAGNEAKPNVGFRCAYDARPGQADCQASGPAGE